MPGNGVAYDAAGNVINDGSHSYSYDAEERISQVDGGTTATYVYDAEGRRVRKTTSSGSVDYLYDLAGHEITEMSSSGAWNRGEVYAAGLHLATYADGTTYFDHADWLGTERVRSAMDASSCETITNLPFGDGMTKTGTCDVSPMHFTGKERDSESGLDHFRFRNFASSVGRFTSPDPINLTAKRLVDPANTLNKYIYGGNNPLRYVDPSGRDITVSYRAPSGASGDAGHILLAVTNQNTGAIRFADYYPKGSKGLTPAPGEFNKNETVARLKQHAALTIQTTPEIAQKLIDAIDKLSGNPPTFMIPFSDCADVCSDLLNMAGIDIPGYMLTPTEIWGALYSTYSAEALEGGALKMGMYRYQPGRDFGTNMSVFPSGTDPAFNLELIDQLLGQQSQHGESCVTVMVPDGNGGVRPDQH